MLPFFFFFEIKTHAIMKDNNILGGIYYEETKH